MIERHAVGKPANAGVAADAQAGFFEGFTLRGARGPAGVHGVEAPAGKGDIARPWITYAPGAFDEQYLYALSRFAEYDRDRGAL